MEKGEEKKSRGNGTFYGAIAGSFLAGILTAAILVYIMMPGMMITVHESRYPLDETVTRLENAIKEKSWTHSGTRNMQKSLQKLGVEFPRQVTLVELCHPDYANRVLENDTHLATLMPCAFAVYEGKDGKVYVSGMNTGLMGKMFGGTVAEVMGEKVSADEEVILSAVIK